VVFTVITHTLSDEQAAEDMYETNLAKNPNDLDTRYNYGRFLWKVKADLPAAEEQFKLLLEADPSDQEAVDALEEIKSAK